MVNSIKKEPDLNDSEIRDEIIDLIIQKNKFEYNKILFEKINSKDFNDKDFSEMGKNLIEKIKLNSVKDNKKFDINAVELLYSLPINSFTLINDDNDNIYLAKIKKFENTDIDLNSDTLKEYIDEYNSNNKKSILKSYDTFLSNKYDIVLNQKTLERVKNFFQ